MDFWVAEKSVFNASYFFLKVKTLNPTNDGFFSGFDFRKASSQLDSALGQLEVSSLSQGGPCHHNVQSGKHLGSIPRDQSAGFSLEATCLQCFVGRTSIISDVLFATKVSICEGDQTARRTILESVKRIHQRYNILMSIKIRLFVSGGVSSSDGWKPKVSLDEFQILVSAAFALPRSTVAVSASIVDKTKYGWNESVRETKVKR
ncbi:hypothetical protein TNCV_3531581 [Trichonephila clavipes]|nr:hypothetical protein TNCV_3531581 [Trichonephila clavipes]